MASYFVGVHIRCCGNGFLWFRSYSDSLFQTPKSKQKALPRRTAPRWGSVYPRYDVHQGASPTVCFATTSSRCVRLRRTALRAYPLMNIYARPAEGAKDQKPEKQKQKHGVPPPAPHHSSGRALARLQLLILIHPPRRERRNAEPQRGAGRLGRAFFCLLFLGVCKKSESP
jgi:hypothetical protein